MLCNSDLQLQQTPIGNISPHIRTSVQYLRTEASHSGALFRIQWRDPTILAQVSCCLLDEVACLVETDTISLCVAHSLSNTEIIGLTSVAISRRALEAIDGFLFEIRYCSY